MKNLFQSTDGQQTDLLCNVPVYVKEHIKVLESVFLEISADGTTGIKNTFVVNKVLELAMWIKRCIFWVLKEVINNLGWQKPNILWNHWQPFCEYTFYAWKCKQVIKT